MTIGIMKNYLIKNFNKKGLYKSELVSVKIMFSKKRDELLTLQSKKETKFV